MIGVKHDYTLWEYFFLWKAGILLFESALRKAARNDQEKIIRKFAI